ncbi:hypothetical protein A1O7_05815 [Cladophialophora yegresii CBS 114405]|uniref:Uncharacterized protein n=1 Tax=Cladophialophora yegresii CBS 114405 TaxID=1182544 RepID=W9W0A3_9EURO|nr:uncharacterized protein A1O7_05815 [Cladophialophora yegresii CBS 114405]EXJ58390.1 hypothetical protein A1O7_05815 [Cladophialophora yegresii CBS 114405]
MPTGDPMDSSPPFMPRVRAYLRSEGFPAAEFDLEAETEAFYAHIQRIAAKMPKLVETLDHLQAELTKPLCDSFQSTESYAFFKNKYNTFLEDKLLDIYHDKPPQLSAFNLFLWTLQYEAKQTAGLLSGRDDHGPLPPTFRSWVAVMLSNVIVFQHHKLIIEKEQVKKWILDIFPTIDDESIAYGVPGTLLHQTWKSVYDRLQDFNRILTFMSVGHSNLMAEVEQQGGGELRKDGPRMPVHAVLGEEVTKVDPKIEIPDLAIPEDLEAPPADIESEGDRFAWLPLRVVSTSGDELG